MRVPSAVDRGASPKSRLGISTGVHAEQATNTACGTPGNFPAPRGKASMCFPLSHMDRGDRQSPASRAPSDFPSAPNAKTDDASGGTPPRERRRLFDN